MAKSTNTRIQLVTFQLGRQLYGLDIQSVDEIYSLQPVRPIPNAPKYVEGILNLRGNVIPIINLHQRFRLEKLEFTDDDELLACFIIINVGGMQLGVIADKILRVVTVDPKEIQDVPEISSGIGEQYIVGVVNQKDEEFLTILNIVNLFDIKELSKIQGVNPTN